MDVIQRYLDALLTVQTRLDVTHLSLAAIAVVAGVAVYFAYFRSALKSAVEQGTRPAHFRHHVQSVALTTTGLILGLLSGWGFLWSAAILIVAFVTALLGRSRVAALFAVAVLILVAASVLLGFEFELAG
jgi:hypothetical protein